MYIIIGIILAIIGALFLLFPNQVYEILESWKGARTNTPSTLYLIGTRIGGVIFLAVGVIAIVLQFLL